jgi:hypothetical protein
MQDDLLYVNIITTRQRSFEKESKQAWNDGKNLRSFSEVSLFIQASVKCPISMYHLFDFIPEISCPNSFPRPVPNPQASTSKLKKRVNPKKLVSPWDSKLPSSEFRILNQLVPEFEATVSWCNDRSWHFSINTRTALFIIAVVKKSLLFLSRVQTVKLVATEKM